MAGSEDGYHTADHHLEGEQRYDDDGHLVPISGQEEGSGCRDVVVPSGHLVPSSGQEGEGSGGRNVVIPRGHVAEDISGVGVPVGRDAGGATSSPPPPVHVTPSILVGTIHAPAPLSSSIFQGGLVGLKFGLGSGSMAGTGATRRLAATGFGALPTSSMAEDRADHAADDHLAEEEEQHYIDDGHLVPSSGQEEEGSGGRDVVVPGGHDGEEDHPDDLVPDLDLDLLVDGVVGPVPGGHLNADAAAFVPTTGGRQDLYSAISSSATAYSHYITSSALAAAGHVSPFLNLPYARAFGSPLHLKMIGPSSASPASTTSHAGLVPYSSPLFPTSDSDSERTQGWILARAAAALSSAPSRYSLTHRPASTVTGPFGFVPISGAPYAPPPSFAPIAGAGPAARPPQQLAFSVGEDKTKLCPYYSHGCVCPRGNTCNYAHGEDDLRMVVSVSSLADADEASSSSPLTGEGDKYKRKLCKTFMSGGVCLFAANCRFAHGVVELGKKPPCWYFFSGQPCPRGDTCGFRHSY